MSGKNNVFRFDAEAWCVVHCPKGSALVQMTSNLASDKVANDYANAVRQDGGHVFRVMPAGVLVAALSMIGSPNELARLRDTLDRISTAAPDAIPACNCGEHEACNRCEIRHLLDIYNGRVPDGPYRRPQPVLTTYKPAT